MRLLAQHPLDGFGNCGEGLAIQLTRDKRRVLWIAHESAPKNVTAVDVTNPRKPTVLVQTALPHERMRSNSLDLVGDLLVVADQTQAPGLTPAGFEIFDVADPAIGGDELVLRRLGPLARRPPPVFVDGEYVHMAAGAPTSRREPQGRPVLPHRGRAAAHSPDGGRALVAARHARWRHRAAAAAASGVRLRLSRAQHQRLSQAPRPRVGRLSRRRRHHPRHRRQGPSATRRALGLPATVPRLLSHAAAVARPRLARGQRRVGGGRGQGLAQAGVDFGRPRRHQARADQHLPAATGQDLRQARRALRRSQPAREPPGARDVGLGEGDRRDLLQWRRAGLRRLRPVPAHGSRVGGAARPPQIPSEGHPAQRRLRGRAADRLHGRSDDRRPVHLRDEA